MKLSAFAALGVALVTPQLASAQSRPTLPGIIGGIFTPAPRPAATQWTGSWSASPLDLDGSGDLGDFGSKTLRQSVHISIGGTSARIHLSNRFGTAPVTIRDVHFARASSDSQAVAGTDHRVTFGGAASITLQPGDERDSDPIAITLTPNSDVAVSMYFPQSVDRTHLTAHRQAWQNVYFANGDVSANASIAPVASAGNLFFLDRIDVANPNASGAVVALGASITDSSNSSYGQNKRWTNLLSQRLADAGLTIGVLNAGLSGNHLLTDEVFGGPSAFHRFQQDVLDQPGVKWVIFSDDPINDLSGRFGSAVQPLSDFTSLVTQMTTAAHQRGIKFYCSTLTPNKGRDPGQWSDEAEQVRQQLDAFYRTPESGCDGIVDQDTAVHDPQDPLRYRPSFNSGDSLHPNDAGMVAIADSVNLGFFTASGVPPFAAPPGQTDDQTCGKLHVGEGLRRNQFLTSCDGRFQAWMQGDGNFVIYQGSVPLGASGTSGSAATSALLLADGRFALYDDSGAIVWQTDTAGLQGKVLLLQNDGNFVLYDADTPDAQGVWSTNTFGK